MVDDISGIADLSDLLEEIPQLEDLLDTEENAPVIRLINALLAEALREGASDLHFELFESRSIVRFRIDGQLRDVSGQFLKERFVGFRRINGSGERGEAQK